MTSLGRKVKRQLTLRGVDEKPRNEAPVRTTYWGFLFVLLHVDRSHFLLLGTK